jgi:hypothetical protein
VEVCNSLPSSFFQSLTVQVWKCFKFHILSDHRYYLNAIFLLNVFSGSTFCPSLLETVSFCVPNQNFRDFKLYHFDFSCHNYPSARCTSVANAISRDRCVLNCRSVSINDL